MVRKGRWRWEAVRKGERLVTKRKEREETIVTVLVLAWARRKEKTNQRMATVWRMPVLAGCLLV